MILIGGGGQLNSGQYVLQGSVVAGVAIIVESESCDHNPTKLWYQRLSQMGEVGLQVLGR